MSNEAKPTGEKWGKIRVARYESAHHIICISNSITNYLIARVQVRVSGVPVTTTYPCDIKPQPIDKLRAVLPRQKQKQTEEKTKTKSYLYKKGGKKKKRKKKNVSNPLSVWESSTEKQQQTYQHIQRHYEVMGKTFQTSQNKMKKRL